MKKKLKKIKNLNSIIFALYGASGAAAGIMPFAKLLSKGSPIVFIDDDNSKKTFMGIDVLSFNEFLALKAERKFVSITISSPKIRKLINDRLKDNDILDWSIHHKNLIQMHNVKIGSGYLISPYVYIVMLNMIVLLVILLHLLQESNVMEILLFRMKFMLDLEQ